MREHLLGVKKLLSGPYSAENQTEKSYLIALHNVKLTFQYWHLFFLNHLHAIAGFVYYNMIINVGEHVW